MEYRKMENGKLGELPLNFSIVRKMENQLTIKQAEGLAKLKVAKGDQTEFDVYGKAYRIIDFVVIKKLVELGYIVPVNEHIRDNRTRMLYRWGKINSNG